jgi:hypothetical protein
MRKWLGRTPSSVADLLWLAGMANVLGLVVLLACGSIVTFGVAGREESLGQAFLCLVYAGLAALLGRWWWGHFRQGMEQRFER